MLPNSNRKSAAFSEDHYRHDHKNHLFNLQQGLSKAIT